MENGPLLIVAPQTLALVSAAGSIPAPRTFLVTNQGSDTLDWSLSENEPWLSAAPVSSRLAGGQTQRVTVTVVDPSLAPGPYSTAIVVDHSATSGSSQTVAVEVTVVDSIADPVIVAAGDIAACGGKIGDDLTADLLDGIGGTILALGDLAYPDGTHDDFQNCYDPTWGRHRERTKPAPGNRDYNTPGAAGYWNYWGDMAGPDQRGWYSFDLGDWHVVALNSEAPMESGSEQNDWLRADLASHADTPCVLAFFHHPLFNSGVNGQASRTQGAWDALYEFGADVILNGHSHTYERFAPQDPNGALDRTAGIREFIVGIGGRGNGGFDVIRANSEVRYNAAFGVLQMTLGNGGYGWELLATDGSTPDSGTDICR